MKDLRLITSKEGLFLIDNQDKIHLIDEAYGYYGAAVYKEKLYLFQYDKDQYQTSSSTGRVISFTITDENFIDRYIEVEGLDNSTHQVKVVCIDDEAILVILETFMQRFIIYKLDDNGHVIKESREIVQPSVFGTSIHPFYRDSSYEDDSKYYHLNSFAYHNNKWYISASLSEDSKKRNFIYILDKHFQLINTLHPEQYSEISDLIVIDGSIMFLTDKDEIAIYNEDEDKYGKISLPTISNDTTNKNRGLSIANQKIICNIKNNIVILDMNKLTANILPIKEVYSKYITHLDAGIDLNHGIL